MISHNKNILVDEETLQVVVIIDWEYSGFYCEYFEAPLWTRSPKEQGYYDIDADKISDLISFLSQKGQRSVWEQSLLNLPWVLWMRLLVITAFMKRSLYFKLRSE